MSQLWLLVVFDVPDRLAGLLSRHKFRPSQNDRSNWWRRFTIEERPEAVLARSDLLAAGLKGRWQQVEASASTKQRTAPRRRGKTPIRTTAAKPPYHHTPLHHAGGNWGSGITARPKNSRASRRARRAR